MSFFKKLFGKKKSPKPANTPAQPQALKPDPAPPSDHSEMSERIKKMLSTEGNTPELFSKELYDSLNRYYSEPTMEVSLNLTDDKGKTYLPHEAFNGTFEEWKSVRSLNDRRGILFSHWDQTEFKNLQKWQVLERFIKDRMPLQAFDYSKREVKDEDYNDLRVIVAFSKMLRLLDSIDQAKHYAKGAYEIKPDLDIVKAEYATVLHLSDAHEDKELAHQLMNEILKKKIAASEDDNIALLNYFLFSKDYIDSSIFALSFLREGKCDLETWELMEQEYYYCPVFRYEYSVELNKQGESLRAMAKMNSLANEYSWYKKAVLANMDIINQSRASRKDPNFRSEDMKKMEDYQSLWEK